MAIFPVIEIEELVQENDKMRIDASKSFVSGSPAIIKTEIKPTADDDYIDVTSTQYLDWQYSIDELDDDDPQEKTISIRITLTGYDEEDPDEDLIAEASKTISVISEDTDDLYSSDAKLKDHESDILKFVPDGKATFKNIHRRVQTLILAWLDKEGYVDAQGNKFTKAALVDISEVTEWATFMALRLIFEGVSNAVDDIFAKKSSDYESLEKFHRERAVLRIDVDGDGVVSNGEQIDIRSAILVRR